MFEDTRFSPYDFKKWMEGQEDQEKDSEEELLGLRVESRVNFKKLLHKIELGDGDLREVAKDFRRNGGVVSDESSHSLFIEVSAGSFTIEKCCVRKY